MIYMVYNIIITTTIFFLLDAGAVHTCISFVYLFYPMCGCVGRGDRRRRVEGTSVCMYALLSLSLSLSLPLSLKHLFVCVCVCVRVCVRVCVCVYVCACVRV